MGSNRSEAKKHRKISRAAAPLTLVPKERARFSPATALPPAAGEKVFAGTCIAIVCDADVVSARILAREIAAHAGLSTGDQTVVEAAMAEVARNILEFAGRGNATIRLERSAGRSGVAIVATDRGPGIANLARALQDGFSTHGRHGVGLAGCDRLMDEFSITSEPHKGTVVTMKKWNPDA